MKRGPGSSIANASMSVYGQTGYEKRLDRPQDIDPGGVILLFPMREIVCGRIVREMLIM